MATEAGEFGHEFASVSGGLVGSVGGGGDAQLSREGVATIGEREQRGGECVVLRIGEGELRHLEARTKGAGLFDFGGDVGGQGLIHAGEEDELGERLAADAAEVGGVVLGLVDAVDLVAGCAAEFGDEFFAVGDLGRGCWIEVNVGAVVGVGLGEEELAEGGDLLGGEAVVRHGRRRVVGAWIVEPCLQPLWFGLVADAGEFGAYVATDEVSCGVGDGVACGAKGFTVETGTGGGIDGFGGGGDELCGVSGVGCAAVDQEGGDVAGIRITELVVRHGGGGSVGLGVLDPAKDPLAGGFVGEVDEGGRIVGGGDGGSTGEVDGVTADAAVAGEGFTAAVELPCSDEGVLVALAAAGLDVARGEDRVFAGAVAVVGLDDGGGGTLAAMAGDAAVVFERVGDGGMFAEGLVGDVSKGSFF